MYSDSPSTECYIKSIDTVNYVDVSVIKVKAKVAEPVVVTNSGRSEDSSDQVKQPVPDAVVRSSTGTQVSRVKAPEKR